MIPIYRAKNIDSDEYVEGFYVYSEYENKHFITQDLVKSINHDYTGGYSLAHWFEIDPATLAIHFSDMLDSQGNKIFASLSEDGKGGDIMKDDEYYGIAKYKDSRFVVEYENVEECLYEENFEVIGIQE